MNRTHTSRTAILVFAHSSEEEAKHKSIAKADALFDVLTAHTLETVVKTGLPYFHFSETQQIGATFGERFTNAIQAVYDKGYERIITIGNDSPQLKPQHIVEAESHLENNKFVLGPSTDGGFYLMGLHQDQFDAKVFRQLEWQTTSLSKQLLRLLSVSVEVFRLPTLFDIDTVADIESFIAYSSYIPSKILQILLHILNRSEATVIYTTNYIQSLHFRLPHNKGSPSLLQSA